MPGLFDYRPFKVMLHFSGNRVTQDLHSGMRVIGIGPLNQLGCNIAQDAAKG
jgi:hypothetical protein